MEATNLLHDSCYCRLCGEENRNGTNLYPTQENPQDLSILINKYLPLNVQNDDQFPKKICPGCHIQLEATKIFLDLIIDGQDKLRNLLKTQQELLKRQEKQRSQLEQVLHTVNPNTKVETYTIESDETGEKFLIQIFSDGPLFPPEHQLSLRAEGLEKPRRKRGRPPKVQSEVKTELVEEPMETKSEEKQVSDDETEEGRRKRKIKAPTRFQDIVQGKELDKILKEEGVIDDDNIGDAENENVSKEQVIGRMESKEGENLGELIVINNRQRQRARPGILRRRRKYQCNICKKEFLHFGRFNLHKKSHKVVFKCQHEGCDYRNDDKANVELHQIETDHIGISAVEPVQVIGDLELPGDKNDEPNDNNDTNERQFKCDDCQKTFACKQNYEVHCRSVHKQERPYVCSKCGKRFTHSNTLRIHYTCHAKETDPSRQYSCDKCCRVFSHPSSLLYHRDSQHSNGRRFVCNQCNKSFKHRQLLQRHQLVHTDDRPHKCTNCKAAFKTRANLLNHQALHSGTKKYWCAQCGQSFAHKTSLTLHQRWHLGQKPYQCDVCKKAFSQKGNLAEHRRIHTGEKPYCCDYCGRAFTTSSQLRLHRKRHTGEKPWRCEYCPKTFLHKDTWKCHVRRHLNDQPYKCRVCERAFTEAWALKKHERLHTGEKPFKCDRCGKMFADNSNMMKHRRTHDTIFNIKDATVVQIVDTDLEATDNQQDGMELRQLVDQQGNPISLTTQDGQQVPVVTGGSDESIQGLLPDGTLIPINISAVNDKVEQDVLENSLPNNMHFLQTENIESEKSDIKELDTRIQFLTTVDNGDGVCLVYEMNETEPTALNSQFLTIPILNKTS